VVFNDSLLDLEILGEDRVRVGRLSACRLSAWIVDEDETEFVERDDEDEVSRSRTGLRFEELLEDSGGLIVNYKPGHSLMPLMRPKAPGSRQNIGS